MKTNRGISMRSQNGSNNIDFNLEPNTNAGMLFARNVASGQAPVQVLPGTSGKQVYGFEAPYQKMFDVVDAISASGKGLPTENAVDAVVPKLLWEGSASTASNVNGLSDCRAIAIALSNSDNSGPTYAFICRKDLTTMQTISYVTFTRKSNSSGEIMLCCRTVYANWTSNEIIMSSDEKLLLRTSGITTTGLLIGNYIRAIYKLV